jgi:hypothetical protein
MELVEKAQLKSKVNLVYSPEFIALGSVLNDLEFPDMILVGTFDGEENTEYTLIQKKMAKNKPQVVNLNYTEAEYAKILVNTYITMKISFANFIGEISSKITDFNPAKVAFADNNVELSIGDFIMIVLPFNSFTLNIVPKVKTSLKALFFKNFNVTVSKSNG